MLFGNQVNDKIGHLSPNSRATMIIDNDSKQVKIMSEKGDRTDTRIEE